MTDVAQAIINGDGETSTGGREKSSSSTKKEETGAHSPLEDTSGENNDNVSTAETEEFQAMDTSDSNQFPDGEGGEEEQDPATDDGVEMGEELEESTEASLGKTRAIKTEKENLADDGDELIIEEDTMPDDTATTSELNSIDNVVVCKIEVANNENDDEGQGATELTDEEDGQNSNSAEDQQVLLNCRGRSKEGNDNNNGATKPSKPSSVSNGNKEEDNSLLTGLLSSKEPSKSLQSTSSKTTTQNHNFSVNDGNAIAKDLEEQIDKLAQLLILKEQEWSAILKLKKHLEFALDQVKCTQRISKIQDDMERPMTTTDVKACMNLIISEKDLFALAEQHIEESIESTENENESLQSIFPFKSSASSKDQDSVTMKLTKSNTFMATAALQKLCERKRKAMDELTPGRQSRLRIVDVQSASGATAPPPQSKVIGNGRKGAIVDVQSIIQSHRNSSVKSKQFDKRSAKPSYSQTIHMAPDRQYEKTLAELINMVDADNKAQKESVAPPVPTSIVSQLNKATLPRSKNGKPVRAGSNNSLLHANPTPGGSGTTLAKMLSPSTHSSIGTHRSSSNDTSASLQKYGGSKINNADSNLSLANLLATSKVDSKINISKIKKDRLMRDEEPSSVPSQQESVPICQGCNLSRAQFVCAGCANQWYCSRECQVAAWDEHSEICSG